jgi:hypothetical protein
MAWSRGDEMTTAIEAQIQRYRAGELTLDQLADTFADYQFKSRRPIPDDAAEAYLQALDNVGIVEEDTWQELEVAPYSGLLTHEEYDVILRRRIARGA